MVSSELDAEIGCISAVLDIALLSLSVLGDAVPLTPTARLSALATTQTTNSKITTDDTTEK